MYPNAPPGGYQLRGQYPQQSTMYPAMPQQRRMMYPIPRGVGGIAYQRPMTHSMQNAGRDVTEEQRRKDRQYQAQQQKLKQFGQKGVKPMDASHMLDSMFGDVKQTKPKTPPDNAHKTGSLSSSLIGSDDYGDFLGGPTSSGRSVPALQPASQLSAGQSVSGPSSNQPSRTDLSTSQSAPSLHNSQPGIQPIMRHPKKDLTCMMFENTDLTAPQKAKSFHDKTALNDVEVLRTRQAVHHVTSAKATDWEIARDELSTIFTVDQASVKKPETKLSPRQKTSASSSLPKWTTDDGAVPELYKQVLEASLRDGSIDTGLVYSILLRSGLTKDVLGVIWNLANRKTPGQLVKQELYCVLALIALVQNNCQFSSLDILKRCPKAPVPFLGQTAPSTVQVSQAPPHTSLNVDQTQATLPGQVSHQIQAMQQPPYAYPNSLVPTAVPVTTSHSVQTVPSSNDLGDFNQHPSLDHHHHPASAAVVTHNTSNITAAADDGEFDDFKSAPTTFAASPTSDAKESDQDEVGQTFRITSTGSIQKVIPIHGLKKTHGLDDDFEPFQNAPKVTKKTKPNLTTPSSEPPDLLALPDVSVMSKGSPSFQKTNEVSVDSGWDHNNCSIIDRVPPIFTASSVQSQQGMPSVKSIGANVGDFVAFQGPPEEFCSFQEVTPPAQGLLGDLKDTNAAASSTQQEPVKSSVINEDLLGAEDKYGAFRILETEDSDVASEIKLPDTAGPCDKSSENSDQFTDFASFATFKDDTTTTASEDTTVQLSGTSTQSSHTYTDSTITRVLDAGVMAQNTSSALFVSDISQAGSVMDDNSLEDGFADFQKAEPKSSQIADIPSTFRSHDDSRVQLVSSETYLDSKFDVFKTVDSEVMQNDNVTAVEDDLWASFEIVETVGNTSTDQFLEAGSESPEHVVKKAEGPATSKYSSSWKPKKTTGTFTSIPGALDLEPPPMDDDDDLDEFEDHSTDQMSPSLKEDTDLFSKTLESRYSIPVKKYVRLDQSKSTAATKNGFKVGTNGDDSSVSSFEVISNKDDQSVASLDLRQYSSQSGLNKEGSGSGDSQSENSADFTLVAPSVQSLRQTDDQSVQSLEFKTSADDVPPTLDDPEENDNFGDFSSAEGKPEDVLDDATAVPASPRTATDVLTRSGGPVIGDRYAAVLNDEQDEERDIHEWEHCLVYCLELIQQANDVFNSIPSSSVCQEVINSEQGDQYLQSILEVYHVVCRIMTASRAMSVNNMNLSKKAKAIDLIWNNVIAFISSSKVMPSLKSVDYSQAVLKTDMDNAQQRSCGVCLLDVECHWPLSSDPIPKINYGGRRYHASCANMWVNRVEPMLPALKLPELL